MYPDIVIERLKTAKCRFRGDSWNFPKILKSEIRKKGRRNSPFCQTTYKTVNQNELLGKYGCSFTVQSTKVTDTFSVAEFESDVHSGSRLGAESILKRNSCKMIRKSPSESKNTPPGKTFRSGSGTDWIDEAQENSPARNLRFSGIHTRHGKFMNGSKRWNFFTNWRSHSPFMLIWMPS